MITPVCLKGGCSICRSWRSIYIWCVKESLTIGLSTMKLNVNYTFDLETWNLQGQGRRKKSRWKQLIKVYLHLMCERVIDHGLDTMKLYVNYTFDLETSNIQGQGHRQRSQWKELIKVYLHLMCERVIDHGLGSMNLNTNNTFDHETWNLQGQGHRHRFQWKQLMKVYLHLKQWLGRDFNQWAIFSFFFQWFWNFQWAIY